MPALVVLFSIFRTGNRSTPDHRRDHARWRRREGVGRAKGWVVVAAAAAAATLFLPGSAVVGAPTSAGEIVGQRHPGHTARTALLALVVVFVCGTTTATTTSHTRTRVEPLGPMGMGSRQCCLPGGDCVVVRRGAGCVCALGFTTIVTRCPRLVVSLQLNRE